MLKTAKPQTFVPAKINTTTVITTVNGRYDLTSGSSIKYFPLPGDLVYNHLTGLGIAIISHFSCHSQGRKLYVLHKIMSSQNSPCAFKVIFTTLINSHINLYLHRALLHNVFGMVNVLF